MCVNNIKSEIVSSDACTNFSKYQGQSENWAYEGVYSGDPAQSESAPEITEISQDVNTQSAESPIKTYIAATVLGGLLAVIYIVVGQQIADFIWKSEAMGSLLNRSGTAGLVLYPLAGVLIYQVARDILHIAGVCSPPAWGKVYAFIIYAAPCAGLFGTIMSLGLAFSTMDVSSGTQNAFETFRGHAGTAFDSTGDGIIIAVCAYGSLLFLHKPQTTEEGDVYDE